MRYALLIYEDERAISALSPEQLREHLAGYAAAAKAMADRGIFRGGTPLRQTASATSLRVRGAEMLVTDGPFAETKEQLGGFFLVECADLDEAIAAAATMPAARGGVVEIRPVLEEVAHPPV